MVDLQTTQRFLSLPIVSEAIEQRAWNIEVVEAGADVLYAPGVSNIEEIARLCAAVDKPVNVLAAIPKMDLSLRDLEQAGVKRVSIGGQLAQIAYAAMFDAARELKDTGKISEQVASRDGSAFVKFLG